MRVAPKLLMSCWGSPTWISLFDSNRPEDNVVTKYILSYSMCLYLFVIYVAIVYKSISSYFCKSKKIRAVHEEKYKFVGGTRVTATDWTGDTSEGLRELTPGHRIDF